MKSVLMRGGLAAMAIYAPMKSKASAFKFRLLVELVCGLAAISTVRASDQGGAATVAPNATQSDTNAPVKGTPRIQFETNLFDFGKITGVETMSGTFKFKNVGNSILKIDPP